MAFDTSETLLQSDIGDELLPGTLLSHGQYKITRFINSGGFGITYLAKDSLDRDVVIKECFSSTFCRRAQTRVRARSQGTRDHMSKIVKSFLNEAQSLARLSHPNIVHVHQVFEENDTAYMALDYIRGHDLLDIIDNNRAELSPDLIMRMATKLLAAVGYIHDNGLLHCDISPDNIFVTPAGEPILIDFGAARRGAAGEAQKYSGLSVVKDGYSPHELYTAGGNSGTWSDVYSLGASLYNAITRVAPANCQSRLAALAEKRVDPCTPLAGTVQGYPKGFLESIDRAMAVMPAARFQTAADWLKALPQPETRPDRKVVLVRRVVPTPVAALAAALAPAPAFAAVPVQTPPRAPEPVVPSPRPRRPTTRVAAVDLTGLRRITGFTGGWLVDTLSGAVLSSEAEGQDCALQSSIAVARASVLAMEDCGTADPIEDIQIAIGRSLILIRLLDSAAKVALCVALDRDAANPGPARVQLRRVAQSVRL
jgi:serine/threonine protein kinase